MVDAGIVAEGRRNAERWPTMAPPTIAEPDRPWMPRKDEPQPGDENRTRQKRWPTISQMATTLRFW